MQKREAIYVNLSPNIKALVQKVADEFGVSMADFVRYILKKELRSLGYLKGTVSLEQSVPIKTQRG